MQPAISARGIIKSFGRQRVLDSLNLDIPSGVTYCLLGPNGSGKTTFIRAIVRLMHLDGGDCPCWAGQFPKCRRSTPASAT